MTDRKFYRTMVHYEVLSEEPIGDACLETIAYQTREGDWSGRFIDTSEEVVNGKKMAALLLAQGSDPSFFSLTVQGEDVDD